MRARFSLWPLLLVVGCGDGSGAPSATPDTDASPAHEAGSATDDASSGAPSGDAASTDAASTGGLDAAAATPDGASVADGSSTPPGDAGTMVSLYVTFYGWVDNSPPGNAIAYPKSDGYPTLHDGAGGAGSYADPITFATDKAEYAPGTRIYLPFAQKYVMMEDDCVECDSDWTSSHERHIDVWMNSNGTEMPSALLACEDHWTMNAATVEVDPPAGRPVTSPPLFDPSTNVCRTTP